jgi:epsilon-lactone hydrolase
MSATVSPEGRATAEAMAKSPMPTLMPPLAVQRQFIDLPQKTFGGRFETRYQVRTEAATIGGVPVVALRYRPTPEHPYPAALDDALAV